MRDFLTLGPVPAEEPCQQVGTPEYDASAARQECQRYIAQLRDQFGAEPDGARLAIKSFPHDFGTYSEVVCYFDDTKPDSVAYAYRCESDAWTTWNGDFGQREIACE